MHKTDVVQIKDLLMYLENELWDQRVSVDINARGSEESFYNGINEGLGRAIDTLRSFNIKGWIIREANK